MSKTPHASNSYLNLVAKAANSQAKDTIEPMVIQKVAQAAGIVEGNLKRYISHTLSKLVVIEKLLIEKGVLTSDEISKGLMDHEDAAWGLETATDGTKANDTLRLVVRKKAEGAEYGLPYNVMIPSVGSGQSELGKANEESLLGLEAGSKKEVEDTENKITLEVFITRVSRRKEAANDKQG